MLKTTSAFQFCPAFLESTPWHVFSINTLIFQLSFSFHIFTYKANTLFLVWLPERTLPLSQIQLTESTHSSSFLHSTSTTNHHENVYYTQTFFSSWHFVGETFSSLENRNFVKPPKETLLHLLHLPILPFFHINQKYKIYHYNVMLWISVFGRFSCPVSIGSFLWVFFFYLAVNIFLKFLAPRILQRIIFTSSANV